MTTTTFDPMNFLKDVDVRVSVELGSTKMSLREVMALGADSVVPLDRLTDELVDISVNGRRIARGEVIEVGDRFGLRIVEMEGHSSAERVRAEATLGGTVADLPEA